MAAMNPPPKLSTIDWAEKHFKLPKENSAVPGDYQLYYVPYLYGIFSAFDNPDIPEIVCMKAAQVAWTTALIAYLLRCVDISPSAMIGMFATEKAAIAFSDEKLVPIVKETKKLKGKIDTTSSRKAGNRALHKNFPGGFLKLITANAISDVKSTPAKLVFVEEPDDASENVKDQGDSVLLLWERTKRQRNPKRILGGTPGVKGFSRVERASNSSDRRVLPIVCHDCEKSHVLDFENVVWEEADREWHPEYGKALPESAVYSCPHCGSVWDDYQRKENIRNTVFAAIEAGDQNGGWTPTAVFSGVAGFIELGELYVCLPGAGLAELVKSHLNAEYRSERGDENAKVVFVNSKLGRPYEFDDDRDDAEALQKRAEGDAASQHEELFCPLEGLLITCGIDVQHDRVELVIRAWGRDEESWLLFYGAIYPSTGCVDKSDPVWDALEKQVFSPIQHARGFEVYVSAVSIDSSDGTTSDAVYNWVRTRQKKYKHRLVMAIKGASNGDPEIFATPKPKGIVDHQNPKKTTKADRHGVRVFIVGTNKAKDWLSSHMKLSGSGPGRFHYYSGVRLDYFDHMTAEAKVPGKFQRKTWQCRAGRRNEAWDCEVYALHAARAKRIHLLKPEDWKKIEAELSQADLFAAVDESQLGNATRTTQRRQSRW
jgi:phage terminase large subunit GpA-like protein